MNAATSMSIFQFLFELGQFKNKFGSFISFAIYSYKNHLGFGKEILDIIYYTKFGSQHFHSFREEDLSLWMHACTHTCFIMPHAHITFLPDEQFITN